MCSSDLFLVLERMTKSKWLVLALILIGGSAAADGPPEGGDAKAWCEANQNACVTWCETHKDADICKEPECD